MDWRKLDIGEIRKFLRINEIVYDMSSDEYELAQELFDRLRQTNGNTFTPSVIDLYIATQLKSQLQVTQRYSREQIHEADDNVIEQFVSIMGLPPNISKDEARERIIRILDLMELIFPLTIGELFDKLVGSQFYYRFEVDGEVDVELTEDAMPRHVLTEFEAYEAYSRIERRNFTYFRVIGFEGIREADEYMVEVPLETLGVTIPGYSPDTMVDDIPATPENINIIFGAIQIPISNGKLAFPDSFQEDDIAMMLSDKYEFADFVETTFEFDHFEGDSRVLDYIEFKSSEFFINYTV